MTKVAHITSKPDVEVGERVLGLCGKAFKIKVLWRDVPDDYPVCRECVDVALEAMTEADTLVTRARVESMLIERRLERLTETLNPADLFLDVIAENEREFSEARREKRENKAAMKRAAKTCTCTWESAELFVEDPDCPIHGGEVVEGEIEEPPIAPEAD